MTTRLYLKSNLDSELWVNNSYVRGLTVPSSTTLVIQIGNSDDKLTQQQWSDYCNAIGSMVGLFAKEIHFSGGSSPEKPWQNYAWVAEVDTTTLLKIDTFFAKIQKIRKRFNQESVAVLFGNTVFV